jgi:CrcB protein
LRYGLSRIPPVRDVPLGTLTVNVTGSFALSLLTYMPVSPDLFNLLGIGLMGGYTTFSTFGFETFRLLEDGDYTAALANMTLNVGGCLIAVYAGFILMNGI